MSTVVEKFDSVVLDVLKEIGNIGAGNAATALAKMISKKVDMKVPLVNVLDFSEVPEILGGPEMEVVGIFFKLEGEIEGSIMFVLDTNSAQKLIELLMPGISTDGFNEFAFSALQEIGNILAGSYISSLSSLSNLDIKISVPSLALDMAGAILSVPAIHFGLIGDKILMIENEFVEEFEKDSVNGFFILIPEVDSYDILLGSLGVQI
ncbi:MAG: chemotaxis protein CheC [Clostridia bacterium]|nr:chemotaxis protein CheC [Clostridia bacterium]